MNFENPNPIIRKKNQNIENLQRKNYESDENIDDPVDSLEGELKIHKNEFNF